MQLIVDVVSIALGFTPIVLCCILFLKRNARQTPIPRWRENLWRFGFTLASFSAVCIPLFLAVASLPSGLIKDRSLPWSSVMLGAGFCSSALALALCAFGVGKKRWLSLASALVSLGTLCVLMLALSVP
jgi:uncharacterized BrkB/YihY/UPF0761 family membrane protein